MHDIGGSEPPDWRLAAAMYRQACDAGDLEGCYELGNQYSDPGTALPEDDGRAAVLLRRACDGGVGPACNNLAFLFHRHKDEAEAAPSFKRACELGESSSCFYYGWYSLDGRGGLPADRTLGAAYLRCSCRGGYRWGCDRLRQIGETP
jgi:TPR repeat protein